jgi:hypothetical protein
VRGPELAIALVLAAFGIRSLVHWARTPFASTALADQVLYAAYRAGRVGMWFAFAGVFLAFAFAAGTSSTGQRFTGDVSGTAWFVVLVAVLGVMQLLGAWFLGRRGPVEQDDRDPPADGPGG